MKAKLWLVAIAGALAGAGAVWLSAHQHTGRPSEPDAALTLLMGASLLGCGLGSWSARRDNRLGPVMVLTAFGWFASQLSETSPAWLYTIGSAIQYLWAVGIVYLLLSFPSGRLERRLDRRLVTASFALLALQLAAMLYGDRSGLRCPGCPHNLLRVVDDNAAAKGWLDLQRLVGAVLLVAVIGALVRRWLQASSAQRRTLAPVLATGCVSLAALVGTVVLDLLGDPLGGLPAHVWFVTTAAVPIAVLYVFLERRLARSLVAGLVVELGEPTAALDLRDALARTLGDPSLRLAFWFAPDRRYVDADGTPVSIPEPDGARRATFVERGGQPIAMLIHDPVLEHNAELVRSVCAAASLALENERLHAELRARLVDLQASRARLVHATDAERRRIERDLHDGTQQRLVSIAMSLGLAEARLPALQPARPIVREARESLAAALAELRELTHGINPPLLVERGLAAGLEELCRRAPLPTRLDVALDRRLPDEIESAAYFTVSEALTNAAKHSHAGQARVAVAYAHGRLTIEAADDGVAGAGPAGGSGLRGLADRVDALGGIFTLSSPPGRGTTVRAEIPCA